MTSTRWKWAVSFKSGTARPEIDSSGTIPVMGAGGVMGYTHAAPADPPALLVGRVGSVGTVHLVTKPFCASDNVLVGRVNRSSDVRFLYYALKAADLPRLASRTAMPLLTASAIGDVPLFLPSVE